jgi:hypothetical protein
MADRHKHPPLCFRPAGDDRDWLAAHAAATGTEPGRILRDALSAYRAALAGAPAAPAVRPQRRDREHADAPAAPGTAPAKGECGHAFPDVKFIAGARVCRKC